MTVRYLARPGRRRRPGRPGLRLLGRRPRAARLRAPRRARGCAACSTGSPPLGVPATHFGVGTAGLLRLAGGGRRRRHRPRLADRAGRGLGARRRPRRPGQPGPGAAPRARSRRSPTRRTLDPRPGRRPAGPRLQPRPRRPPGHRPGRPRAASWTSSTTTTPRGAPHDRRRRPAHGLRQPRPARPGRGLLHRHPARAARRRPHLLEELLGRYRAIGGGSPLSRIVEAPAGRPRGGAGRAAAARSAVYAGMRHIEPRIGDDRRGDGRRRRGAVRGDRPRAAALVERRRATGAPWTPRWPALGDGAPRPSTFVDSWHDQPRFIEALAETTARGARAASPTRPASASCSPPTACPARVVAEGDPYPDELAGTAALVAERLGLSDVRLRVPERRPHRRAVAGPGHPRRDPAPRRRGRRASWSSGRSASSPTTSRSSTTSTSRRRPSPARSGIRLERARSMNDDPTFIAGLADLAAAALPGVAAPAARLTAPEDDPRWSTPSTSRSRRPAGRPAAIPAAIPAATRAAIPAAIRPASAPSSRRGLRLRPRADARLLGDDARLRPRLPPLPRHGRARAQTRSS